MRPRKGGGDAPPKGPQRRPVHFWRDFNDWWRQELEASGKRPDSEQINRWYRANAKGVWGGGVTAPSMQETRVHAKCLRTVSQVRDYFRKYREVTRDKKHEDGKDGDSAGSPEDVSELEDADVDVDVDDAVFCAPPPPCATSEEPACRIQSRVSGQLASELSFSVAWLPAAKTEPGQAWLPDGNMEPDQAARQQAGRKQGRHAVNEHVRGAAGLGAGGPGVSMIPVRPPLPAPNKPAAGALSRFAVPASYHVREVSAHKPPLSAAFKGLADIGKARPHSGPAAAAAVATTQQQQRQQQQQQPLEHLPLPLANVRVRAGPPAPPLHVPMQLPAPAPVHRSPCAGGSMHDPPTGAYPHAAPSACSSPFGVMMGMMGGGGEPCMDSMDFAALLESACTPRCSLLSSPAAAGGMAGGVGVLLSPRGGGGGAGELLSPRGGGAALLSPRGGAWAHVHLCKSAEKVRPSDSQVTADYGGMHAGGHEPVNSRCVQPTKPLGAGCLASPPAPLFALQGGLVLQGGWAPQAHVRHVGQQHARDHML